MRIALCDDDIASMNILENLIRIFCREQGIEPHISRFAGSTALLTSNEGIDSYDVIFMDIYLKPGEPLGTDLIHSLGASSQTQVVFVTTSREYAVEAFRLNAAHYLVKPVTQEDVSEAMARCMKRLGHKFSHMLDVKTKQGTVSIPMENIVYIEIFNKLAVIHTLKNVLETHASLNSLWESLDESLFMRAQRSYIVNMACIDAFSFDRLILTDGTQIMLSRNNRGSLKMQYQKFLFSLARKGEL